MSFSLGNEGARELTEENSNRELVPLLTEKNQEIIYDDDSVFYVQTTDMFRPIPINVDVSEKIYKS